MDIELVKEMFHALNSLVYYDEHTQAWYTAVASDSKLTDRFTEIMAKAKDAVEQ